VRRCSAGGGVRRVSIQETRPDGSAVQAVHRLHALPIASAGEIDGTRIRAGPIDGPLLGHSGTAPQGGYRFGRTSGRPSFVRPCDVGVRVLGSSAFTGRGGRRVSCRQDDGAGELCPPPGGFFWVFAASGTHRTPLRHPG
jgi:hypothetical protein